MKATKLTRFSRLAMGDTKRSASRLGLAVALAAGTLFTAPAAEAIITHIVIDPARSQSPTFSGRAFGTVGCACGSSGGTAWGLGGVMAWGRGHRGEGAEGVDVDCELLRARGV
jgi:hypothetical protein